MWGIGVTLYEAATGDAPFDSGETADGSVDGSVDGASGGEPGSQDDWYPQLEETAPPTASRRRLPRDLAAAIDGCLRPDPAARPTIPELAAVFDANPPALHRAGAPPSAALRHGR